MTLKSFKFIQRTTSCGHIVALPFAVVSGSRSGPSMGIVAAVHGCEYPGIEAAIRLYRNLDPEEMEGTLRLIMVANLPAFRSRTMYTCPIDGMNLGQCFPGSPNGSYSEIVANIIWEELVDPSDYVLDLHGGDLIESLTQYVGIRLTGNQKLDREADEAAFSFGAQNIEMRPLPTGEGNLSLHCASARAGKVGLLVEAGSQGRRDEVDVLFHYEGIMNLMRHIGMLPGPPPTPTKNVRILDDFIGVKAGKEGVFYPLIGANDLTEKGQAIGEIRDFTGEVLERVYSPAKCVALGVITSASTFEGSMLFGLGRVKE